MNEQTLTVRIRAMHPDDYEAVFEVARALANWFTAPDQLMIAADLARYEGVVAEIDERVVGFAIYHPIMPDIMALAWIGVAPSHQQHGIGSQLLDAVERIAHARGYQTLEVRTIAPEVPAPHFEATRRFYLRRGFKVWRREEHVFGIQRHALVLVKQLTSK
ncbi:MAG: N-acetyltransferase [Ardenticatenia bacterium]|nr:MAG: N-acetyltransferase [Ardenticatenia bacterium]